MKKIYRILPLAALLLSLASCTESHVLPYEVEKPESIANQEIIDAYADLKTYVDRTANPDFKLGVGISLADYVNKSVQYRLVNKNFDEVSCGYEMKHGAIVQSDGKLALDNVNKLLKTAQEANVSVFGHTLCWHANQNATYLNKLIAPDVLSSTGPGWDLIMAENFETDNTLNYTFNSGFTGAFTAVGQGNNNSGRALVLTNASVRANEWDAQLYLKFSPAVILGEKYRLTMDVRSDVIASSSTQAQLNVGGYKHWDFFGSVPYKTTWSTYVKEITISAEMVGCNTIAFNLGKVAGTFYYDNVKIEKYNATGSIQTKEKTPEQKKAIIDEALEKWIKGMVTNCAPYVKAWDVVNEPMSDWPDPTQLKTGVGKTLAADEFYWQDYLGKDYAVRAIQLARKYGNAADKLFINDYGLEAADQKKCQGLIQYIQYVESKGVKVDGIGTQMHVTLGETTIEGIRAMLTKIAATGKLVKISELDMGIKVGGVTVKTENVTSAQLQQMSDFYQQIVKAYFEIVPAAQRYGITQWAATDSPDSSSWRGGEPIGLWKLDYTRKPAYAGFADGLKSLK